MVLKVISLITKWDGNVYRQLNIPSFDKFRWRHFEKTGCLITADGSEDDKINPEDLSNYKVPSTAPPASSIVPEKASNDT